MTERNEIIKMARESGLGFLLQDNWAYHEQVERFFHMAQAAEREACAKVCVKIALEFKSMYCGDEMEAALICEKTIRERGQA